jgi:hypothetical protein
MDFATRAIEMYVFGFVMTAIPLMICTVVGFFLEIMRKP